MRHGRPRIFVWLAPAHQDWRQARDPIASRCDPQRSLREDRRRAAAVADGCHAFTMADPHIGPVGPDNPRAAGAMA